MNNREQQAHAAREILTDARLVAFLQAADAMEKDKVFAVEILCNALREGKTLNEMFYNGDNYGYMLSVVPTADSTYQVEFGCLAHLLAGDGGAWEVVFSEDQVRAINGGWTWDS